MDEVYRCYREWSAPLILIQRIEAGQITLPISDYNAMPKTFFSVWDLYRREANLHMEEHKQKTKK